MKYLLVVLPLVIAGCTTSGPPKVWTEQICGSFLSKNTPANVCRNATCTASGCTLQ